MKVYLGFGNLMQSAVEVVLLPDMLTNYIEHKKVPYISSLLSLPRLQKNKKITTDL